MSSKVFHNGNPYFYRFILTAVIQIRGTADSIPESVLKARVKVAVTVCLRQQLLNSALLFKYLNQESSW